MDVGLELGLNTDTLEGIRNEQNTLSDCTRAMLSAWLKKQDQVKEHGGPSWQQLASALRVYGYKSQAKVIERKYCIKHK